MRWRSEGPGPGRQHVPDADQQPDGGLGCERVAVGVQALPEVSVVEPGIGLELYRLGRCRCHRIASDRTRLRRVCDGWEWSSRTFAVVTAPVTARVVRTTGCCQRWGRSSTRVVIRIYWSVGENEESARDG